MGRMVVYTLRICTVALVSSSASAFASRKVDRGGKSATKNEDININNCDAATSASSSDHLLVKHSRLSLAPMMDYTNRHFRAMVRLISAHTLLYTEMVAADELLDVVDARPRNSHSNHHVQQFLGQSAIIPEGPSVLQLGGNDASQLSQAAKIYHEYSQKNECKYISLNLNCGCPSPAVAGKKCFGAALMKDSSHVVNLVRAIHDGAEGTLPVTVKCRIGLHEDNGITPFSREVYNKRSEDQEYEELLRFVDTIASDGIVKNFQIHARIAVLGGSFSPAENRKVPPLKYNYVRRLAREFPELNFVLNGGMHSLAQVKEELEVDESLAGVMVGRALVADPWGFATVDELLYGDSDGQSQLCANRRELLEAYGRHADYEEQLHEPAMIRRSLVAPCAHLFAGEANSKQFRMELDEIAGRPERLEKEATARIWSSSSSSTAKKSSLASALSTPTTRQTGIGWDDLQIMDDARPAWDANEPPISQLILEAAQRNFGNKLLDLGRRESYHKKECACRVRDNPVLSSGNNSDHKVSGGVVDGWFSNGLN